MSENIYIYPVVISVDNTVAEEEYPYFIVIPDLNGFTQAKTLVDAIEMARDYIGNNLIEREEKKEKFPSPSKLGHSLKENEIETLIDIDLIKFKAKNDNKVIKKTLSIPT